MVAPIRTWSGAQKSATSLLLHRHRSYLAQTQMGSPDKEPPSCGLFLVEDSAKDIPVEPRIDRSQGTNSLHAVARPSSTAVCLLVCHGLFMSSRSSFKIFFSCLYENLNFQQWNKFWTPCHSMEGRYLYPRIPTARPPFSSWTMQCRNFPWRRTGSLCWSQWGCWCATL